MFTYGFDRLFVKRNLDVEVFEVIIGLSPALSRYCRILLTDCLTPCSVHLIELHG